MAGRIPKWLPSGAGAYIYPWMAQFNHVKPLKYAEESERHLPVA